MSLKDLPLHKVGVISDVDSHDNEVLKILVTIGALPQTELELLQKRPTYVIRMGYSTFAIDESLAGHIRVEVN